MKYFLFRPATPPDGDGPPGEPPATPPAPPPEKPAAKIIKEHPTHVNLIGMPQRKNL
jgi:hypothetical protein